jgi:DnaK suppressor protein
MDESAIREVLVVEQAAALARIRAMQADLDAIVAASAGSNTDDEHDPEGSTIAYERAQVTALLAGAQANLADLDDALARLSGGAYLLCERCHSQIAPERLAALPAARTCFACANSAMVTEIPGFGQAPSRG